MQESESLYVGGTSYTTSHTEKYRRRKFHRPYRPEEIRAIIPGVVQQVLVQPGDRVARGSGLLVLEAMKMRNELTAPMDGTVRQVHVAPGQKVPKGELLVTLRMTLQ